MKMLSENIKTGDIVEIKNAYFKNDNGLYFVSNSKGDVNWCGDDYCLKKICKNGKLSTAKYNICFWPLQSFTNSREKRIAAKKHNEEFATIEKVENIDKTHIIAYFENEAESLKKQEQRAKWDWGEENEATKRITNTISFYNSVIDRLTAAQPKQEQPQETSQEAQYNTTYCENMCSKCKCYNNDCKGLLKPYTGCVFFERVFEKQRRTTTAGTGRNGK